MSDTDDSTRDRLKAAVWLAVGEICESQKSGLNIVITQQLIASLTDVVFTQAELLGKDVESFAKHAKRTTVSVDDVKLAARRNTSLHELIIQEANRLARGSESAREAKRKKK
ncbi:hypothetical protein MVEG_10271 [Podila verticillata NRRL 6337]|nr:MAG: kinetochore component CENP-S-domain-containing protein [Podila humilis]KFH63577.1 hypothetical protein MVEG_10271 [Podila verticillata NRRL 6337]